MTPAEEAAKIAGKYVTVVRVRCLVCQAAKAKPRAVAVAEALRNTHGKSFPLICRYLSDQGIKIRPGALNSHFYRGHLGHKDLHENRPGRSRA